MKRWLALSLALLFALVSIRPAQPPDEGAFWVVRAYYSDEQMVREIASWIEPWEVHPDQGYVVVGVSEADFKRFETMGFRLEIDPELTQKANQPAQFSPLQTDGIPGYSAIAQWKRLTPQPRTWQLPTQTWQPGATSAIPGSGRPRAEGMILRCCA
jgi:hypothetical protein